MRLNIWILWERKGYSFGPKEIWNKKTQQGEWRVVDVVDGGSGGSPGADVDGEEDCEQRPELE